MKRGQVLGILALFLVCAITVIPAIAANVTTSVPSSPDAATDNYNNAVRLTASGDYAGAIAFYDAALGSNTTEIQESDGLLYVYQGKSYAQIQMGNYSNAITTINTGLTLYPNDETLLNNMGIAQYNLGNYADAVTSYNKALAIDVNFTGAIINKGDALVKLGKYQDAVTAYQAALANNPGNSETATKLAAAQKAAASELPVGLIVLVIVVIIAAAGVAYYTTKKASTRGKATNESDKKTGKKKLKK